VECFLRRQLHQVVLLREVFGHLASKCKRKRQVYGPLYLPLHQQLNTLLLLAAEARVESAAMRQAAAALVDIELRLDM